MKISVHPAAPDAAFAESEVGRRLVALLHGSSPANRTVADFLLRNPVRVSGLGIEDLAAATAVSTASLSRFARAAGFRGYGELRGALAETLQAILQPVEKLRDTFERPRPGASPHTDGLEATLASLRMAAEGLAPDAIEAVVARLQRAPTVYVMGFGLSAHAAGLLTLGLQPFCPGLINVVEFGGTEVAAGRLMNVARGDMLVVISVPRYARDAVQLTHYARDRGAGVVAITDSPASPLARLADHLLLAPSRHPVLSSSLAAAVLVVEALVTGMMVSSRANVNQAAKLTEAISSYLYRADDARPAARRPQRATSRRRKPA
ncbi:MurR/RpiR family transcriptional regulator [Salinarimonas soli]|uniref:MurR/RpiR family transcriptional regulator n=1 Tax=Salinarimonas soli TaxID=1638099 RepID=A0A5B2VCI5_9HYPH|nr:MurR/RpiR family transcriptional regulator [Salinarimonas soli]KAA2235847.1 MurR/RpiR family transcriptional regulator [Salinarimonas soli]